MFYCPIRASQKRPCSFAKALIVMLSSGRCCKGLCADVEGTGRFNARVVDIERDLVAGGVAAVADDLDIAFLAHCGVRPRRILVPELDLDDVGFQVIQHQIAVDDGLQTLKQRVARLGVVGADLALLLVAVDGHRRFAHDVAFLFNIGRKLRAVLFQVLMLREYSHILQYLMNLEKNMKAILSISLNCLPV